MIVEFVERNLYAVGSLYSRSSKLIESTDTTGTYSVVDKMQSVWISIEDLADGESISLSFNIKYDEEYDYHALCDIVDGVAVPKIITFNANGKFAVVFNVVPSKFTILSVESSLNDDSVANIQVALTDFDGK